MTLALAKGKIECTTKSWVSATQNCCWWTESFSLKISSLFSLPFSTPAKLGYQQSFWSPWLESTHQGCCWCSSTISNFTSGAQSFHSDFPLNKQSDTQQLHHIPSIWWSDMPKLPKLNNSKTTLTKISHKYTKTDCLLLIRESTSGRLVKAHTPVNTTFAKIKNLCKYY